jgi:CubicO group peptidase (beta-lactamase class C family)
VSGSSTGEQECRASSRRANAEVPSPPGTRVSHQSTGILLAAGIAEQVSGQRLDTYLQHRFLVPLCFAKFQFI